VREITYMTCVVPTKGEKPFAFEKRFKETKPNAWIGDWRANAIPLKKSMSIHSFDSIQFGNTFLDKESALVSGCDCLLQLHALLVCSQVNHGTLFQFPVISPGRRRYRGLPDSCVAI
jgi:hypothetical protein